MNLKNHDFFPFLAIVCVPILYGTFYIITKTVNQNIPIFWMITFRMLFALIGFLPFIKKIGKIDKETFKLSLLLSSVFLLGVVVQTKGLQYTTAGKSGFIGGLFIILTPILSRLFYKTRFQKQLFIPISVILIGLFIMFFEKSTKFLSIGIGEIYNFIGALSIALHILFISKYLKKINVYTLTLTQIVIVLIFSAIIGLFTESNFTFAQITNSEWMMLVYLGIATTTFTFILQIWGQKFIDETTTAIIISSEPVYATFFGWLLGQEVISWQIALGGIIILGGFIITILIRNQRKIKENTSDL